MLPLHSKHNDLRRPFTGGIAVSLFGRRAGVFGRMIAVGLARRQRAHGEQRGPLRWSSSLRPYWTWFCLGNLDPIASV
jgi:hypothetical protein